MSKSYPFCTPVKEKSKPLLQEKTDCFAYCKPHGTFGAAKCNALHELYCKHENCRFYKPMQKYEEEEVQNRGYSQKERR